MYTYVAAITDKQTKLYPNDLLCNEVGKEIKACPLMIQWLKRKHLCKKFQLSKLQNFRRANKNVEEKVVEYVYMSKKFDYE